MNRNAILIITNNPMVQNINDVKVCFVDNKNENAVYYEVLNYISKGHPLLSHPLAGSVKPNENPYRSIVVGKEPELFSLKDFKIMESCLHKVETMTKEKYQNTTDKYDNDLQMIDKELLDHAIYSLCGGR